LTRFHSAFGGLPKKRQAVLSVRNGNHPARPNGRRTVRSAAQLAGALPNEAEWAASSPARKARAPASLSVKPAFAVLSRSTLLTDYDRLFYKIKYI